MTFMDREATMKKFRTGESCRLVTTGLCSRGVERLMVVLFL